MTTKLEGGGAGVRASVVGPLVEELFCGFPQGLLQNIYTSIWTQEFA